MAEITVKDLILDDAAHSDSAGKAASRPTFEIAINSGPDFAIRRTQGQTSRLLVMLVSQEQYYIKNEKTDDVQGINLKTLQNFFKGMDGNRLTINNQWIEYIEKSKPELEYFLKIIDLPKFKDGASSGIWRMSYEKHMREEDYRTNLAKAEATFESIKDSAKFAKYISKNHPNLPTQLTDDTASLFELLRKVADQFSVDEAYRFADRYITYVDEVPNAQLLGENSFDALFGLTDKLQVRSVSADIANERRMPGNRVSSPRSDLVIPNHQKIKFDFNAFCEYLFVQSEREGLGDRLRSWVQYWGDTLMCQELAYNAVTDKYPEYLLSHHYKLMRIAEQTKSLDDLAVFQAAVAKYEFMTFSDDEYSIIVPNTYDDIRNEARDQSNCLVTYVPRILNGTSAIFFMRRNEAIEKSYITIEVVIRDLGDVNTYTLLQVKERFNRSAHKDDFQFLKKWCEKYSIDPGSYRTNMR